MSPAPARWVPDRLTIASNTLNALVVGGTLYVLDGSLGYAALTATLFLALNLVTATADAVLGDYAGNALFGLLVLAASGYAVTLSAPLWAPLLGAAIGGWYVLDGVQHRRYGVTRDEGGVSYHHDGSVLTGLPKALLGRLAEPFLLSRRSV
jgi:hypothetical protein